MAIYEYECDTCNGPYEVHQKISDEPYEECHELRESIIVHEGLEALTEKELHKLTKISYKAFQNSILFAQGDLHGIASASPQERKALLKEPLQISMYTKFEKLAKDKSSNFLERIDKGNILIAEIGNPEDDIKDLEKQIFDINKSVLLDEELRKNDQIELDHKRAELLDFQRAITSEVMGIRKDLDDIKTKIKSYSKNFTRLSDLIKQRVIRNLDYENGLNIKFDSLNKLNDELKKLQLISVREMEEAQSDLDKALENEHRGRVYIARAEGELGRYSKSIPEDEICTVCLQEITSVHRKRCEKEAAEQSQKLKKTIINNKNK